MPQRAAAYRIALLLLALLGVSGSASDTRPALRSADHVSVTARGHAAPGEVVAAASATSSAALVPSWMPGTALQFRYAHRAIRHSGRPPTERRGAAAVPVVISLYLCTVAFANPDGTSAAARTRAGACSSFATSLPPPVRA
jgi:hypothetical protein